MRGGFALSLVALVACGPRPSERPRSHVSGRFVTIESGGAQQYNAPVPAARSDALTDALLKVVIDAAAREGTQVPVFDDRLSRASAALANIAGPSGELPLQVVEFAVHSHGIIENTPHLLVLWDSNTGTNAVVEQIAPYVPGLLAAGITRFGVGTGRRNAIGNAKVVVAFQTASVRTSPIPRHVDAGGTFDVDVTLERNARSLQIAITRPSGVSRYIEPTTTQAGSLEARIECGPTNGALQIQLVDGENTFASFPIWCGTPPPTSFTFDTRLNDTPNDPLEAERRIHALINVERERVGAPPLIWNDGLGDLARDHSRQIQRSNTGLPPNDTLNDRVRALSPGIDVATNLARARGMQEVHDGLLGLPSVRVRLLSPALTHIGIGIIYTNLPTGGRELHVVQLATNRPLPQTQPAR